MRALKEYWEKNKIDDYDLFTEENYNGANGHKSKRDHR